MLCEYNIHLLLDYFTLGQNLRLDGTQVTNVSWIGRGKGTNLRIDISLGHRTYEFCSTDIQ
jgi:hypothetical protein